MENIISNKILFSFFYLACIFNSHSVEELVSFNNTNNTVKVYRRQNYNSSRRQALGVVPNMEMPSFKKAKDDGFYEPYWESGHWVFNRQASTLRPQAFFLNKGKTKHRECNQVCIDTYQDYGFVCGMRLKRDDWTYENKTFQNICYLQLANCVEDTKRYGWFISMKGNCSKELTRHSTNSTAIYERLSSWLKNYQ